MGRWGLGEGERCQDEGGEQEAHGRCGPTLGRARDSVFLGCRPAPVWHLGRLGGAHAGNRYAARMRRFWIGISFCLGLGLLLAMTAGPRTQKPGQEPYVVVTSKPIVHGSWRSDASYVENSKLSELFNQLARDGLVPMFTQISTEVVNLQALPQDRLIVVCRRN